MKSKVGERGQVTIPKPLRERLGILSGEEMEFEQCQGEIVLRKAPRADPLRRLVGLIPDPVDVDAYLEATRGPAWSAERDGGE